MNALEDAQQLLSRMDVPSHKSDLQRSPHILWLIDNLHERNSAHQDFKTVMTVLLDAAEVRHLLKAKVLAEKRRLVEDPTSVLYVKPPKPVAQAIHATVTGRVSSSAPQSSNTPKPDWEGLRDSMRSNPIRHARMVATMPREAPPRVVDGQTPGIEPLRHPALDRPSRFSTGNHPRLGQQAKRRP